MSTNIKKGSHKKKTRLQKKHSLRDPQITADNSGNKGKRTKDPTNGSDKRRIKIFTYLFLKGQPSLQLYPVSYSNKNIHNLEYNFNSKLYAFMLL